jgi:hypothetical protein
MANLAFWTLFYSVQIFSSSEQYSIAKIRKMAQLCDNNDFLCAFVCSSIMLLACFAKNARNPMRDQNFGWR